MDRIAELNLANGLKQGALRLGHTEFLSGGHADGWVEKGALFSVPQLLEQVASAQAHHIGAAFPEATLLVGAPACGAVLASFVARHLQLPVAYMLTDGSLRWHRMHVPTAGQHAVDVDDLICTGEGAREIVQYLNQEGHHVLGISCWLSRVPLDSLITLEPPPFQTYTVGECPLCQAGQLLTYAGVWE
ncbi:phosphoribosyltransferase [Deinococcus sp. QL22]|uniref:phosphoribosyltransferase n=1 Tax=Deinococcus sp. QL22 TaxID=2939437 RepID=UPI002017C96B|nr:phosphoribosyltransferase [Deinococcus sp. QL22]UQN08265.1 phosphoribosyltransferase [Deinococcus sp. QL22]